MILPPGYPLDPEHQNDLEASGLLGGTIVKAGVRSASAHELKGLEPGPLGLSAIRFQYWKLNGTPSELARDKYFPPIEHVKNGKKTIQRYGQPKDTDPEAYTPPFAGVNWEEIAADPTIDLRITEGEKKTLAALQVGLICLGIPGVWNWLEWFDDQRMVIQGLEPFVWKGRRVELVPDSDVWRKEKFQALRGFYALGQVIKDRQSLVTFRQLPESAS